MKRLTAALAFKAFAAMPPDERSINGLYTRLKAEGHRISRNTLAAWARDERWDERLTRQVLDPEELRARTATIVRFAQEPMAAGSVRDLKDALADVATLISAFARTAMATLPQVEVTTAEEGIALAHAAVDMLKTAALAHQIIQGVSAEGAKVVEGTVIADELPGDPDDLISNFNAARARASAN